MTCLFRAFATGLAAQRIDLLLHARIGELSALDREVALQLQLVDDVAIAGRQFEVGLERQRALHRAPSAS